MYLCSTTVIVPGLMCLVSRQDFKNDMQIVKLMNSYYKRMFYVTYYLDLVFFIEW